MSEFPSIETLTAAKNAVERDRVIRETWEALVAAVYTHLGDAHFPYDYDTDTEHTQAVLEAAIAYVKARKGNE